MKLISFRAFRKQCYLFNRHPTAFTYIKNGRIYKTIKTCKQMNIETRKPYLCTAKTCPYFSKLKEGQRRIR